MRYNLPGKGLCRDTPTRRRASYSPKSSPFLNEVRPAVMRLEHMNRRTEARTSVLHLRLHPVLWQAPSMRDGSRRDSRLSVSPDSTDKEVAASPEELRENIASGPNIMRRTTPPGGDRRDAERRLAANQGRYHRRRRPRSSTRRSRRSRNRTTRSCCTLPAPPGRPEGRVVRPPSIAEVREARERGIEDGHSGEGAAHQR